MENAVTLNNNCQSHSDLVSIMDLSDLDIEQHITKDWIEVQNGLSSAKSFFYIGESFEDTYRQLKTFLSNLQESSEFSWKIKSFVTLEKHGISVFSFYSSWDSPGSLNPEQQPSVDTEDGKQSIKNQAYTLWYLEKKLFYRKADSNEVSTLSRLASSQSFTISTYAADLLTRHGYPTIPSIVSRMARTVNRYRRITEPSEPMFEDRIDVCAYNFFESVHPAYAKQTIATVAFIEKHCHFPISRKCIDVGTGPGMPLFMLLEMLPELSVTSIEPSEIAYHHLCDNIRIFGIKNVQPVCTDFLTYNESEQVPLIISTGSSHHFNTHFFFQKAFKLLEKDGVLIVADELIEKYNTVKDRKLNIIKHHTKYMLSILFDHPVGEMFNKNEKQLIDLFRTYIPNAAHEALSNNLKPAEHICRALLDEAKSCTPEMKLNNQFIAFYRLILLELEALVAGLDYEVEQKTYPQRLIQIASLSGFKFLNHDRVYATNGHDDWDAGTHVFAFKKDELS